MLSNMLPYILIIAAVIFLISYYFIKSSGNFPPGPVGLPLIGYLPFLEKDAYKQFYKMSKKYGKILMVQLGPNNVIVLNDNKSITAALVDQGNIFSERPCMLYFDTIFKKIDIASADGATAKYQRRFAESVMRTFGFSKSLIYLSVIEEMEKIIKVMETKGANQTPIAVEGLFFVPILNIMWKIFGGKKFAEEDDKIQEFSARVKYNFEAFNAVELENFFPVLRFFGGWKKKYNNFLENCNKIHALIKSAVDYHRETFVVGNEPLDFIDVYLEKIIECENDPVQSKLFNEEKLISIFNNFFHGGVDTTENILYWSVAYMILWPDIQRKVQEEIDSVIGKERYPTHEDIKLLPYTNAVIYEILRFTSLVPFSIPHMTLKATKLLGYDIPKGTRVLANIWAVHNDPELWQDPEIFNPNRFLNSQGELEKSPHLIAFSVGPRYCVAEKMAMVEIFLFFTSFMQRFIFKIPTGYAPPSLDVIEGIAIRPRNFHFIVEKRA